MFTCAGCGAELFPTDAKFDSGSGWPSFTRALADGTIEEHEDKSFGMRRTEITCARCGGHLGHVFPDGPAPDRPPLLRQLALPRVRARPRADTGPHRDRPASAPPPIRPGGARARSGDGSAAGGVNRPGRRWSPGDQALLQQLEERAERVGLLGAARPDQQPAGVGQRLTGPERLLLGQDDPDAEVHRARAGRRSGTGPRPSGRNGRRRPRRPGGRPGGRRRWRSAAPGPTSSATISILNRRSPSSVSQLRCSRRPVTMHPHPLGQAEGHVLGQVPPGDDVEEGGGLLPLVGLPVLPPAVGGHADGAGGLSLAGVADLGVPGQVPDDRRGGGAAHWSVPSCTGVRRRPRRGTGRATRSGGGTTCDHAPCRTPLAATLP